MQNSHLSNFQINHPVPVLNKGMHGSWDDFGVRDPAILCDAKGRHVIENDAMVMYYTGSTKKGSKQAIGRAISIDNGNTWRKDPIIPVIRPEGYGWDGGLTSTAWVLKDDDGYYKLFYRGGKGLYNNESIGLAISHDGINFKKHNLNPVLTPEDFTDIFKTPASMGVINIVRNLTNKYLLSFESRSVKFNSQVQIFTAISEDGFNFKAFNGGYPIFSCKNVTSWPVTRVANPRITLLEENDLYMLCFNGANSSKYYSLGIAFSNNLTDWDEHPNNPILIPTGYPVDYPFSGRLEGGVILKEDLTGRNDKIRCYIMGIPQRGPSHKNGVIGLSHITTSNRSHNNCHVVKDKEDDIKYDKESQIYSISHSEESRFPPSIHFMPQQIHIKGIRFQFKILKTDNVILFHLDNQLSFPDCDSGIKLRLNNGVLRIKNTNDNRSRRFFTSLLYKLIPDFMIMKNSLIGWKKMLKVGINNWNTIELVWSENDLALSINDKYINISSRLYQYSQVKCFTVTCIKDNLQLKQLSFINDEKIY